MVPDSDGDRGSFIRLPFVLSGPAPHQHVSVFQFLRSRSREAGAAFAGDKHKWHLFSERTESSQ